MVKDIDPGSTGSYPNYLTNVNGTLFFSANDGHGTELWRSDGTIPGTQMLVDISSGPRYLDELTNVGGTLLFVANDGHGNELWRSDGTSAGTQIVKDFNPGTFFTSAPYGLTNVAGTLFFNADDDVHGAELWRSDGTAGGTQLVADINPGNDGSYPRYLTNVRGTLFFVASDNIHGEGLWDLAVTPEQTTSTSLSVTPNGSIFFGDAITLTADVLTSGSGSFAGTTGTVDFMDGATTLASGLPLTDLTTTGGSATLVIPSGNMLALGRHDFEAVYSGDRNFATSEDFQSDTIAQALARTTVSLSPANGKSVYGQDWAATATVKALAGFGGGSPTSGTVTFIDTILTNSSSSGTFLQGGKTTLMLGSASVGAGGVAVLSAGQAAGLVLPGVITAYLSNGTRADVTPVGDTITAQVLGNADYSAGAVSSGVAETISRDPTQAVIIDVTPAPAQFSQTVTLTAIIRAVGGGVIAPVGSVTFTDSYTTGGITTNTTLGTVRLPAVAAGVSQAQATFTTASLSQRAHTLRAIYNGDTTAPFPLPASFPFRGQWLPNASLGYGFVVQGDNTTGTLSANPPSGQKEARTSRSSIC